VPGVVRFGVVDGVIVQTPASFLDRALAAQSVGWRLPVLSEIA
jgi:hypothetical protein